ncbi:unnamed protein product [Spodoptera exigua]|nr:unnamed protein product [Spodoptera exigua]
MLFINSNRPIDIFTLAGLIYVCALYKIHDYLQVNKAARTAADMSQDVCHRQRRSLNEFQSGRAKKTRAEHARIKSSGAGAAPREAPSAPRSPPPHAAAAALLMRN